MEHVGAVFDEVTSEQGVWTGEVEKVISANARGLECEAQSGGKRAMGIFDVREEETIRLEGIVGEEETADGVREEVFGTFKNGGAGVAPFGGAVANKEAGHMVFDEAQIEGGEELGEAGVGPAIVGGEEINERIENHEAGINAFDGFEEEREVVWEREGTIAFDVGSGRGLGDEGEECDTGEVSVHGREALKLAGGGMDIGGDDDHAAGGGRMGVVGWGMAAGDVGGKQEREEAFASAVVAVEEGDTVEGDAFFPEPAEGGVQWECGGIVVVDGEGVDDLLDAAHGVCG